MSDIDALDYDYLDELLDAADNKAYVRVKSDVIIELIDYYKRHEEELNWDDPYDE